MPKFSTDFRTGIVVAIVGAIVLFVLIPHAVVVPTSMSERAISAAFWPRVSAIMLIVFGFLIALVGVTRPVPPLRPEADSTDKATNILRVIGSFAILFAAAAMVPYIGIPGAAGFILLVFCWIFGEKRWVTTIPLAIVLPGVLYFFFVEIAGIPIPIGILGD